MNADMPLAGRPIVAEVAEKMESPVPVLQLAVVRERVSNLMDRLARGVFDAGLDLDDCVFEKFVVVRQSGSSRSRCVPLESMTDPAILAKACGDFATTDAAEHGSYSIIELRARAVRAPDYPDRSS